MRNGKKIAVITGGCGSIGMACARKFIRDGQRVVLVDRNQAALDRCIAELNLISDQDAIGLNVDLFEQSSASLVVDFAVRAWGRIDILVNNAGLSKAPHLGHVKLEDWNAVLMINLTTPMLLSQEAMRCWQDGLGGRIVNLGSRVWQSGSGPAYTSSKAGVVGLTRSMAVQLGPLDVTVNAVAPSYIDTPFNEFPNEAAHQRANEGHLRLSVLKRLAVPEDIANAVCFLASDGASFITGETLHVCGGSQLAGRPDMFFL